MYLRKAITIQANSCHNLDPDLQKHSDTQSILMYDSVVKKNHGREFFKIKL